MHHNHEYIIVNVINNSRCPIDLFEIKRLSTINAFDIQDVLHNLVHKNLIKSTLVKTNEFSTLTRGGQYVKIVYSKLTYKDIWLQFIKRERCI